MRSAARRAAFLGVMSGLAVLTLNACFITCLQCFIALQSTSIQSQGGTAVSAQAVIENPHQYRVYTSPYYAEPRTTLIYNTYMTHIWSENRFRDTFRFTRPSFFTLVDHLRPALQQRAPGSRFSVNNL